MIEDITSSGLGGAKSSTRDVEGASIRSRALRGGVWLATGNALAKAANFVKRAILAHFLSPNDFGLMGVALLMLSWLEYFTETGFRSALVQRRDDIDRYLSTVWTLQVVRSLGIAVAIIALAPAAAVFFDAANSIPIVRCIAMIVVLRGFTNPALVALKRQLDFRRQTLWNLSGAIVGLIVGVGLALVRPDVWALVVSVIAAEATRTAMSYVVVRHRPRWGFRRELASALFDYGRWIFLFNVVLFLSLSLDSIAVGRWVGVDALGIYQMGYQFAFLLLRNGAMIAATVMFPALSRVTDAEQRTRAFLAVLTVLAPLAIFGAFAISHLAEPLISILYGSQWVDAAPVVAILSWAAAFDALSKIMFPFFNASGSPQLSVATATVKTVVLGALLYPLVELLGLRGAAIALTLAEFMALAVSIHLASKVCRVTAWRILDACRAAAVVGAPWLALTIFVRDRWIVSHFLLLSAVVVWSAAIIGKALHTQFTTTVDAPGDAREASTRSETLVET